MTVNGEPVGDRDEAMPGVPSAGSLLRRFAHLASLALIALILVLVLRLIVAEPYRIPSESMLPTLEVGDRVVVNRLSYTMGDIERGQVVVFERPPDFPGDDDVIKRVIALPGETVRFTSDAIYIDGLRLVEPYLAESSATTPPSGIPGCDPSTRRARECVVPGGQVFVLGDNRGQSIDSRSYGPVPIDTVIGRAAVRVWPLSGIDQL